MLNRTAILQNCHDKSKMFTHLEPAIFIKYCCAKIFVISDEQKRNPLSI